MNNNDCIPRRHNRKHREQRRFPRRCLLALCLCLPLLLLALPTIITREPVVRANAFVIGSDPIDGSTINTPPGVIRIFFNAPIGPGSVARVYVFAPNQLEVDTGRNVIPANNPRELDTYLLPPSQLPQDGYEVQWTALDSVDGRATHGLIGFNIGHSSTGVSGVPLLGPSTSNCLPQVLGGQSAYCSPPIGTLGLLAVIWEWLVAMTLTVWVGLLVAEGVMTAGAGLPARAYKRIREQARALQGMCLSALLAGEVVALALRDAQLSQYVLNSGFDLGVLIQLLFGTFYGYVWLARVALLIGALALLRWPGKQASSYVRASLLVSGLILLTLALSGDVAQQAQPHASAIVFDWFYLAARSILLGSLVCLGYVWLPHVQAVEQDACASALLQLLRRFLPLILTAASVLLVTALFLAEASLGSAQQLFISPFGQALFAQYLLLALVLALSLYVLFVLRSQLIRHEILLPASDTEAPVKYARSAALGQTTRRIRQSLHWLAWLGAMALLCAAIMPFYGPPISFPPLNLSQSGSAPTTLTQNVQTKQAQNLTITLQLLPNSIASPHTVIVTLSDNSGRLITNAQVQVVVNMRIMNMGTTYADVKSGTPLYVATFPQNPTFSMAGLWNITLTIHQPGQAPLQVIFPVELQAT